jgi:TP901-1 family phage major tail protein
MSLAAKNLRIKTGVNPIKGLNDASFNLNGETIEVTTFESAGWKERISGLKDFAMSLSGFYEKDDALGQGALKDALLNGTSIPVDYLVDGAAGFRGDYLVTSFETGASASGEVTASYSLESTGALTII